MRAGAIVAACPPHEVLTEELPREVFGLEARVITTVVTGPGGTAVAAVLSLRNDADIVLESTAPLPTAGEQSLATIAQRVGLSQATLQRLRRVRDAAGAEPLTTRQVAERLQVQQRTARRMLHRLELAGLAQRTGSLTSSGSGRPLTLYRLTV